MTSTQITNASGYNTSNMFFSKPEVGTIPGSKMTYKRIKIGTRHSDGSMGDLILKTTELFSFGVQENTDMQTGVVNGYTLPICLWNKDRVSDKEKEWTDTFNNIVDRCKEYIISVKDDIGKYDLEMNDLKKFNPLYWKREQGKIVEGRGPTLYPKLFSSSKTNAISSIFTDSVTGEDIDPLSLLKKYFYTESAIKIESIFIGNKISLQVKLYEAVIRTLDGGMKKLISRPAPVEKVSIEGSSSVRDALGGTANDEEDEESENDSGSDEISESESEEESAPTPAPAPKKVVKRVVRRKKTSE